MCTHWVGWLLIPSGVRASPSCRRIVCPTVPRLATRIVFVARLGPLLSVVLVPASLVLAARVLDQGKVVSLGATVFGFRLSSVAESGDETATSAPGGVWLWTSIVRWGSPYWLIVRLRSVRSPGRLRLACGRVGVRHRRTSPALERARSRGQGRSRRSSRPAFSVGIQAKTMFTRRTCAPSRATPRVLQAAQGHWKTEKCPGRRRVKPRSARLLWRLRLPLERRWYYFGINVHTSRQSGSPEMTGGALQR